jgi:aldehyde:ferredoxin oxidoreductase
MYGWNGRILRVNLTTGETSVEEVDPRTARDFIGGRGWAIRYLYNEMDPRVDPLSPENKLVFSTGPLTATPVPTGNRYMVTTKSPLTGAISCSNSGGFFPTEMKRTGFDLFIFEGRAGRPVYLWVNDDRVELRPADHLWGRTVFETEDMLRAETDPRARVACIGPAGERLAPIAAILNDKHRAAARSGVGAVMGSKNLKAVVVRGTRRIPLARPDELKALADQVVEEVKQAVAAGKATLRTYGTAYVPPRHQRSGHPPHLQLPDGGLRRGGGHLRPHAQPEVSGPAQGLLRLPHRLRAGDPGGGPHLRRRGGGAGVRDHRLPGQRMRCGQPGRHHQSQLHLQRTGAWTPSPPG